MEGAWSLLSIATWRTLHGSYGHATLMCFMRVAHLEKSETSGVAREMVDYDVGLDDMPLGGERFTEILMISPPTRSPTKPRFPSADIVGVCGMFRSAIFGAFRCRIAALRDGETEGSFQQPRAIFRKSASQAFFTREEQVCDFSVLVSFFQNIVARAHVYGSMRWAFQCTLPGM